MKILQVIHGFPPYYMAGSEVYTYNLCQELKKDHEIFVFTRIEDPYTEPYAQYDESYHGLKIRRVNKPKRDYAFTEKYIDETLDRIFSDYIDSIKPDIVHFGHLSHLSTNLVNILKEKGLPVIYTLHDFWLKCYRGQLINTNNEICSGPSREGCYNCVLNTFGSKWTQEDVIKYRKHMDEVINNIDVFLSPSKFLKNFFVKNGIPEEKIRYSKYGFNKELIKKKERKYESGSKISFGFMGRVIPVKGIEVLLEAFSDLEKSELHIFGSVGNQLTFLQKYINENVILEGPFDNWDIDEKVLSDIDVLVVPSIWYENSPLVIQEAFMAGIPVITSDIGGMAELVDHEKNGFTFKTGDAEALKSILKRIEDDPTLLNGLHPSGEQVRSIEDDAEFIIRIYKEVLKL